jgi:transposase
MIPNFTEKHATLPETSLLRFIFAYIEFIALQEPAYKTGRPRISRKIMLKCFLLQAYFGIASLRKLVDFLKADSYWCCTVGFSDVPHFSTFSRAATWLRTEGFSLIHQQVLSEFRHKTYSFGGNQNDLWSLAFRLSPKN